MGVLDHDTREDIVKNLLLQTGVLDPTLTLEKILLTYCYKMRVLDHDTREDIVKSLLLQTGALDDDTREDIVKSLLLQTGVLDPILTLQKILL